MTDPDEHLIGTPWDMWRSNVAVLLGIEPADVSNFPDSYECFNTLMTEIDYCAMVDRLGDAS